MTLPRLIATDLDGTAVRSDHTVSERTAAAFARVERAGAMLVLVTGRPPRWMRMVAHAVSHRGVAICANGAIVYDMHTERIVDAQLIPVDMLGEAVERIGAALPGIGFAVEHREGPCYADGFTPSRFDAALPPHPTPIERLVTRPAVKLLARHPELEADALLAEVTGLVADLVLPTHSNGRHLIEMSALGVSKASTLATFCAEHGIAPADVAAFGDMPNDLAMLAWAGRSYAVANAHPDVLAAVDHKVAGNDEDGVARTIEELFPE